jgi:hypothetical protein
MLAWKANTRTMNPTVPKAVIDQAFERDPASASAEYGAEFRSDVAQFVSREAVEACISPRVLERPRIPVVRYQAFVDPSGGSSDSMTLAIGHQQLRPDNKRGIGVLDVVREIRAPFSPEAAVAEFAQLLQSYGIRFVRGDRYGAQWTQESFKKVGIEYRPADLAKTEIYRDFLPRLNSGEVDLLDNQRLVTQLLSLERRTARGGRDSIDHPPGGHDDLANAAAGALVYLLSEKHQTPVAMFSTYSAFAQRIERSRFDGPILEGRPRWRLRSFTMRIHGRRSRPNSMLIRKRPTSGPSRWRLTTARAAPKSHNQEPCRGELSAIMIVEKRSWIISIGANLPMPALTNSTSMRCLALTKSTRVS